MTDQPIIVAPALCSTCLSLVVHGAGFAETDPWQALTVVVNAALFQASSRDRRIWDRCSRVEGSDERDPGDLSLVLAEIGCLGCFKPKTRDALIQHVRNGGLDNLARVVRERPYADLDAA